MIYFTADLHLRHENVISFCKRPFANADEMNEAIIANWNERVRGNDTVFILGDVFFRCACIEEILGRLRGKKKLITGNHDTWVHQIDCSRFFESIDQFLETSDGNHAITLCHYPLLTWKHAKRSYMIHGHIHNDRTSDYWPLLQVRDNVLNAGVDVNFFKPVSFEELLDNNRRFKAQDDPYYIERMSTYEGDSHSAIPL